MDVIILSFGKITHTPVGLADVLCDEYELKLRIENTACTVFKDYGYRMVQIPTFEYFDVYNVLPRLRRNICLSFLTMMEECLLFAPI